MISNSELDNIIETLSSNEGTLDDCYTKFSRFFPQDQFRPCCVVVNLMNSNVLGFTHRIIAIFVILESFKENTKTNPFSMNLIEIFEKSESAYEKKFIYNYMVKNNKDLAKTPVKNLQNDIEMTDIFRVPDDFQTFKKSVIENIPNIPGLKGSEIKNVVPDFNLSESNRYTAPNVTIPAAKIDLAEVSIQGFQPDFIRPIPTPLAIADDEPMWLSPNIVSDLIWDYNMCASNNMTSVIKELCQKALKASLAPEETKLLHDAFEKDPKLVFKSGITPQVLPQLVEQNPVVASTVLIKLLHSTQLHQYLEKLVDMRLTLASMEVVNKLANSADLPKEFLTLYITNCISHCEEKNQDKMQQNRLVRLVCVFIKSLIKNKIINPREMIVELQAFCIEFSKIPEASALFKLLKGLDPTGAGKE